MQNKTVSTNALKIWAIIAMVCDHAPFLTEFTGLEPQNYYAFPWYLLHAFGRLTAPLFFYLLAVGYGRTRDKNRYTLRLLVFAALSYVPYIWYFEGAPPNADNFQHLNVIFTMLFGLLLLRSLHEISSLSLKALCVCLCLAGGYWCDYGLYGLALILICDLLRGSRRATLLGMGAVMMVYVYVRLTGYFGEMGPLEYLGQWIFNPVSLNLLIVLLCQLLPLILIARHRLWRSGGAAETRPGPLAKWGFYIFYPAHITVLLAVRLFVLG